MRRRYAEELLQARKDALADKLQDISERTDVRDTPTAAELAKLAADLRRIFFAWND